MKTCSRHENGLCEQSNPQLEIHFYKMTSGKDGLQSYCKSCQRDLVGKHAIERKYGITWKQKEQMFTEQDGKCALKSCGFEFKSIESANVDHDHKTGQVRGLLCHDCNTGLGKFKDNMKLLLEALNYLKEQSCAH